MNKPLTLQVQETEQGLIDVLNKSNLSPYILKTILQGIYQQLDQLEINEIEKYKQEQAKKDTEKKDKKATK